ncbi:hypothetical protein D9756_002589 [Leucocoprinus leucothites]|uniref:Protein kinase domain-containing protein n=1 Tax=Leucocoprinus leucothites TaxID=201217 RepID=A0A8H5GC94_9AGAR|nr:hypothetical protein D9756_002589 [Leucoagaricus leucothites]
MEAATPESPVPNESDVFAALHHLVSRIDIETRVDEVVKRAQSLNAKEKQLLVDCLSMALDREATPLRNRTHVWRSLIEVASSVNIFAQNHTLSSQHLNPEDDPISPGVFRISGNIPARVKILKQIREDTTVLYTKSLISYVHLSHPNILPLYAVFFDGEDYPSIVTPCITNGNICDYVREHPEVPRPPLISDVINGLFHIHQLNIAHGGLHPENVLISVDGRALLANPGTASATEDLDSFPVRYSAPELVGTDDTIEPTQATDMWSFACLCYEVLSGKVPFFQIARDFRVSGAILSGIKPSRPGREGAGGDGIDDAMWQLLLLCWELDPKGRPFCLQIHQILLGMTIEDTRPAAKPIIQPGTIKGSALNLEYAKDNLMQVLSSDHSPSLRVPKHLRKLLSSFLPDTSGLNATVAAAKKLSPDDTQMLVDFLDLVLEDLPDLHLNPICFLLSSLMVSTRVIPLRYKLTGIQYDPIPISSIQHAKAYKARGLNVCVNAVTASWLVKSILARLPDWYHASHPKIIQFYGVFHEGANESPWLFVVTPFWANGNMEDYALTLPQKSRLPLISDAIDGLIFLDNLGLALLYCKKEHIMVSDDGRAVLLHFDASTLYSEEPLPITRQLRFYPPNARFNTPDVVWSFACFCYTVLSRKLPYYQYTDDEEIQAAISRGELPKRPEHRDDDMDQIDDQAWNLITKCCRLERNDRPAASTVQDTISSWRIEDHRLSVNDSPGSMLLEMRARPNVDFNRVESLLSKIQVELLREPLSKLLQNHIKDVMGATTELDLDDTRILVDFLDLALKNHLSISEEQNRVLALLSRITSSTHIFPQRYELKGIKYHACPMAEGGYGTIHRGTDLNVCVKVMTQVDPKALTPWIRELIVWAHASHPNILPFCGVLLENVNNSQRICLVSPFMKNGNLHDYGPRLSQKSRIPLILDVINGLHYLHGLGIVHSDLKGENVLISNEGRAMITDFGTTQITTATVTTTASLVPTTLRFAAPEVVLTSGPPTKERDIWSFGCLCYEILSREVPYYQYAQTVQVSAALARKELPKRPGSTSRNTVNEANDNDWDDDDDEDWDEIDDQAWDLIIKCCKPEPEDRLKTPAIQELIVDMKIWDDRPAAKGVFGTEISKLRTSPEINLNRVGELLDKLQKTVVPAAEVEELSFIEHFNSSYSRIYEAL